MGFDRTEPAPGLFALVSDELAEIGIFAAFTERLGGVSSAPFDTLNASFSVGDDGDDVRENRERVRAAFDVPPFAIAGIVHGSTVTRVGPKRRGAGFGAPGGAVAGADGLATASPQLPIAVTTADCVPLVYGSTSESTVVVVHAGWRGFAAGIVAAGIGVFRDTAAVRVAIGPAIGPCHYEVGADVALAVAAGSPAGAVTEGEGERLRLDLVGTARSILVEAGVHGVTDTGLCTACAADRFFSHRRDGEGGRQLAIAMRR
jgi:hypothetical protein